MCMSVYLRVRVYALAADVDNNDDDDDYKFCVMAFELEKTEARKFCCLKETHQRKRKMYLKKF